MTAPVEPEITPKEAELKDISAQIENLQQQVELARRNSTEEKVPFLQEQIHFYMRSRHQLQTGQREPGTMKLPDHLLNPQPVEEADQEVSVPEPIEEEYVPEDIPEEPVKGKKKTGRKPKTPKEPKPPKEKKPRKPRTPKIPKEESGEPVAKPKRVGRKKRQVSGAMPEEDDLEEYLDAVATAEALEKSKREEKRIAQEAAKKAKLEAMETEDQVKKPASPVQQVTSIKGPKTIFKPKANRKRRQDSDEEDEDITHYIGMASEQRKSGRNVKRQRYQEPTLDEFREYTPPPKTDEMDATSEESSEAVVIAKKGRKKKVDKVNLEDEGGLAATEVESDIIVVEKILGYQQRKVLKPEFLPKTEVEEEKPTENGDEKPDSPIKTEEKPASPAKIDPKDMKPGTFDLVDEFLVKYKGFSYIHCEWRIRSEIADPRIDQKIKRYMTKRAQKQEWENDNGDELFNPDFTVVDRVLDESLRTDPVNGEVNTFFLVKWCALPYEDATWEVEEDVDNDKIERFRFIQNRPVRTKYVPKPKFETWKPLQAPQKFKNGTSLRPYQIEGVSWLLFNFLQDKNCILADEMGLGKTVQSVTFFEHVRRYGIDGPFLVVAPLSTLGNWMREFELWSDMNAIVYHGSSTSRDILNTYEMFARDSKGKIIKNAYKFDAVITTYECIIGDYAELKNVKWRSLIIANVVKNFLRQCE